MSGHNAVGVVFQRLYKRFLGYRGPKLKLSSRILEKSDGNGEFGGRHWWYDST